jgi:hypothetical protein
MALVRPILVGVLLLACAAWGQPATAPGAEPQGQQVSITIEDGFVAGESNAKAWAEASKSKDHLPEVVLMVEGSTLYQGRLRPKGDPRTHAFFGRYLYRLGPGARQVHVEFSVPSRNLHASSTLKLTHGRYLYIRAGRHPGTMVVEQTKRPRLYR